ncbi:MAG: hypothetical protein NVS9B4_18590 [Candidatus Acidiferrum sp.]
MLTEEEKTMGAPAITILAMPKPFHGHIGVIQRNAISSWAKLLPRPEIFLFGEEEGVAELAAELNIGHLHDIGRNDHGTPLLNDLLKRAKQVAAAPVLCYLNSDIILLQEFLDAVRYVARKLPQFLAVARRCNVEVGEPLDFSGTAERRLREEFMPAGHAGDHTAIDAFVFTPSVYDKIPRLAIGRAWFDQWLIKDARLRSVPVVDLTSVASAIHQSHDYAHIEGGQRVAYGGEEAQENLAIYGGVPHAFTLLDVTHELLPGGELRRVRFRRQNFVVRKWLWRTLVQRTAGLRQRLGLKPAMAKVPKNALPNRNRAAKI